MSFFIHAVRRISLVFGIISVLLLLAAVFAVCHLVFVRYALGQSAIWQHEFVTYSLVASTFLGSPYVLMVRGHVNVDLLPLYLGPRAKMALALLAAGISLAFCVILAWSGFYWWHEAWANNWHGETVWSPTLWIPWAALPIGFGLVCLQYLAEILALVTGREPPFGHGPEETLR